MVPFNLTPFASIVLICAIAGVLSELPDFLKFYHDPSGEGLYQNFSQLIPLNSDNFDEEVYRSRTSWLIEFYNSWCGDCHRFSPTWKKLTLDLQNWRSVVKIGAVDCTNPKNTKLCREYEIKFFPTVKYFPSYLEQKYYGLPIDNFTSMEGIKHFVIDRLRERNNLPVLVPFNGLLEDIWSKTNASHALAVVESMSSYTGSELVLDLIGSSELTVLIVEPSNQRFLDSLPSMNVPAAYFIEKNGTVDTLPRFNRDEILYDVSYRLSQKGIDIPQPKNYTDYDFALLTKENVDSTLNFQLRIKEKLYPKKFDSTVFRVDIEGALSQSLFIEIPSRNEISGCMLTALQNYTKILKDYFPAGANGKNFLRCVHVGVADQVTFSGALFYKLVENCLNKYEPVFLPSTERWIGCKGSTVFFRGYPCSLWTMFHTLTVQAYVKGTDEPKDVLDGMTGYMKHFFGCSFCSRHFLKMAVTFPGNVTTTEDSVLWLWKAHNSVNRRLFGDETEDPTHYKHQFPPKNVCKNCTAEDGMYDDEAVLPFLREMYTYISPIVG
ncbi:sulfhydryl oxidase 2-like [Cimex lectularius]|uniref:Sulfhydryl oxidase n=1 Tax=Cimex lectularius TaxID=79782 RepID=A0A8I6RJR9_CIMLE|nr:sulfhydryl oxidase 2-like [Cimex lectularius]